jgi:hypothetical protein
MKPKRTALFLKIGIALVLVGSLDPMEGSLVINVGSIVIAICTWIQNNRWKWWSFAATTLITVGVVSLWTVSSFGGFEPETEWWWLCAILPYPVGWLATLMVFVYHGFNKVKLAISNRERN